MTAPKIDALAVRKRVYELRGKAAYLGYTEAQLRAVAVDQLSREWHATRDDKDRGGASGSQA